MLKCLGNVRNKLVMTNLGSIVSLRPKVILFIPDQFQVQAVMASHNSAVLRTGPP